MTQQTWKNGVILNPPWQERFMVFENSPMATGELLMTFDTYPEAVDLVNKLSEHPYVVFVRGELQSNTVYYRCPLCKTDKLTYNEMLFSDNKKTVCCLACNRVKCKRYSDTERGKTKQASRDKSRRAIRQEAVAEYLSNHPCIDCGEDNIVVLEFDHKEGQKIDKQHEISHMLHISAPVEVIIEEMSKCDIRCANCHRIKTMEASGSYRIDYVKRLQSNMTGL